MSRQMRVEFSANVADVWSDADVMRALDGLERALTAWRMGRSHVELDGNQQPVLCAHPGLTGRLRGREEAVLAAAEVIVALRAILQSAEEERAAADAAERLEAAGGDADGGEMRLDGPVALRRARLGEALTRPLVTEGVAPAHVLHPVFPHPDLPRHPAASSLP